MSDAIGISPGMPPLCETEPGKYKSGFTERAASYAEELITDVIQVWAKENAPRKEE